MEARVDQWNRINSKAKPIGYGQMGFCMADKNIVWRKNSLSTNDAGYHDNMWYLDNKIPQIE